MPIERKPRSTAGPEDPAVALIPYRVRDGDSWIKIAKQHRIDARSLVFANFRTRVPAEVNWYLRNRVGCKVTTRDGKNWMFSSSASPGIIGIPTQRIVLPEMEIVGRLPPRFFTVTTSPEQWTMPGDAPEGADDGLNVVSRDPWTHGNLSIGAQRITTRGEWGANEPIWANEVIYYNTATWPLDRIYTTIVVHHTDNDRDIKTNEAREQGKGFAAIGYHFFIEKSGRILEGRPLEVMGSHAGTGLSSGPLNDPDWGAIGIVMQGDYHHADDLLSSNDPPPAQLDALRALVGALRSRFGGVNNLLMHKEVKRGGNATVCPGDALYEPVGKMRKEMGMSGGG